MRVLVTGASGFLGAAITRQLLARGHAIRALVRDPERLCVPSRPELEVCLGDLRDLARQPGLLDGIDAVCHTAGLAHTEASRALYEAVNVQPTAELCALARAARIRRFVLVGSVSVYTIAEVIGQPPRCPPTAYALSKLAAEQAATRALEASPTELVILRLAPLFGPGGRGNLARLIHAIDGGRFVVIGDGRTRKCLLHREDAARAIVQALGTPDPPTTVFNVGGEPCCTDDLVKIIAAACGRRAPWHIPGWWARASLPLLAAAPAPGPRWAHGLERWLADESYPAEPFRRWADWHPTVPLAEGLAEQVREQRAAEAREPR